MWKVLSQSFSDSKLKKKGSKIIRNDISQVWKNKRIKKEYHYCTINLIVLRLLRFEYGNNKDNFLSKTN